MQASLLQLTLKGTTVSLIVVMVLQLLKTANEEDLQRLQSVPWRYGLDSPQGGSVHVCCSNRLAGAKCGCQCVPASRSTCQVLRQCHPAVTAVFPLAGLAPNWVFEPALRQQCQ